MMNIKTIKQLLAASLSAITLSGCDMFEYHPYSTEFEGRTNIHAASIEQIERLCKDKEEITFAFITDTQGSNTNMQDAIQLIRERGDIDFIVHGGDQTDFGLPKEFMWCRDLLETSRLPYVSVIAITTVSAMASTLSSTSTVLRTSRSMQDTSISYASTLLP